MLFIAARAASGRLPLSSPCGLLPAVIDRQAHSATTATIVFSIRIPPKVSPRISVQVVRFFHRPAHGGAALVSSARREVRHGNARCYPPVPRPSTHPAPPSVQRFP